MENDYPPLSFEDQDAIESLIFTGDLSGPADIRKLEDYGLIQRGTYGEWFYSGGPVSQFFEYAQTKGMTDGLQT